MNFINIHRLYLQSDASFDLNQQVFIKFLQCDKYCTRLSQNETSTHAGSPLSKDVPSHWGQELCQWYSCPQFRKLLGGLQNDCLLFYGKIHRDCFQGSAKFLQQLLASLGYQALDIWRVCLNN